ncbi:ammonium transporter [Cylindrobasidium torrendii FP15055 ss-10]|uniref:Ammonium transporter n=1 Tax=Cylindrobasidium torrendii FP15055 ss-10 TaxID=1314674 RepID=A0A0D7BSU0_9AGAR|nr:ammonium transporter [Cylindrobasidium torrendii FP15055 ss-10]
MGAHTPPPLASVKFFDRGDVSFILAAGALVSFMVPGLAFLYSGLARRKSALTLIWIVSAASYSLAFSPTATNGYIGNLHNFGLRRVLADPSPGSPLIPDLLYAFFQMEFACVTSAILMGGIAERGRLFPAVVFIFLWLTIVYCPLACWAWATNGWGYKWGVLDFAGGGPVEIGSGVGGLAFSWVLGKRQQKELVNFRPHNVSMVNLGTFILWFGWLGFNGGSAFGANLRAVMAIWNSMLSASFGGMTWCLIDFWVERRWSMVGFCSGTIAGLVAATPTSGYIHPWAGLVVGVISGAVCNFSTKFKFLFRIDDALDLFAEHAIGGIIGLLLNAFLADSDIIALDGVSTTVEGGFMNRNWKALYIQFAYVCATCAYTFVMTALLAKAIDMVPGLHLRGTPEEERVGMDEIEIGEFATDYIEITRDFDALLAQYGGSNERNGPQVAAGDRHGRTELGTNGSASPRMTPVVEEDSSDVSIQHEIIASKKDNEGSMLV